MLSLVLFIWFINFFIFNIVFQKPQFPSWIVADFFIRSPDFIFDFAFSPVLLTSFWKA